MNFIFNHYFQMPEKTSWSNALEALNDAIVLEKEVYNQLHHIHDVADTHCKDSHVSVISLNFGSN